MDRQERRSRGHCCGLERMEGVGDSIMSWFIPVLIGFLAIYIVRRLIPRSKVDVQEKYVLITGCDSGSVEKPPLDWTRWEFV